MTQHDIFLDEIKKAIGAHGQWKLKLRTAITTGRSDASPCDVKRDNLCAFGNWLYGPTIDAKTRQGMPYKVIKRLHAEFHECASRVLELALAGKKDEAVVLLDVEYTQRSNKLIAALSKWQREIRAAKMAA